MGLLLALYLQLCAFTALIQPAPPPQFMPYTVPALYSACQSMPCRLIADVVGGTIYPAAASANDTLARLTDGTTATNTSYAAGYGLRTTVSLNPYITLNLDDTAFGVGAVGLWAWTDTTTNIELGQNLTVWLHNASANFSAEPSPYKCAERINLVTRWEAYAQCANTTRARFVTIRRVWNRTVALGLQEVAVYLDRERHLSRCDNLGVHVWQPPALVGGRKVPHGPCWLAVMENAIMCLHASKQASHFIMCAPVTCLRAGCSVPLPLPLPAGEQSRLGVSVL